MQDTAVHILKLVAAGKNRMRERKKRIISGFLDRKLSFIVVTTPYSRPLSRVLLQVEAATAPT